MNRSVLAFCRDEALFSPGDRVVCAVSGGADSVALLHCLLALRQELGITVSAAHFNHRLRGQESDADEAFVRALCAQCEIELFTGSADVAQFARERGLSLETAAREKRYAFLRALPCNRLATAHNADDNAETVLLHLLRGSGLRGLCGIPVKNGKVVRPLLQQTRAEIVRYLQGLGQDWREDSSNAEDGCLRNRLRHQVLPLLRQEQPSLSRQLAAQSRLLRQEDACLDALAADCLVPQGEGYAVAPLLAAPLPLRRRALRLMLRQVLAQDVSQCHIAAVLHLLESSNPSARCSLPGGLTVCRSYDTLELHTSEPPSFCAVPLAVPGVTQLAQPGLRLHCALVPCWQKSENTPFHFAIKYDMIRAEALSVRPRRTGDGFLLPNGHRKSLKKLCIDRKIPRAKRGQLLVLAQGERVLAVSAFGVSADALPQPGAPALVLQIESSKE